MSNSLKLIPLCVFFFIYIFTLQLKKLFLLDYNILLQKSKCKVNVLITVVSKNIFLLLFSMIDLGVNFVVLFLISYLMLRTIRTFFSGKR